MDTNFIKIPYSTSPSMVRNEGPVFNTNPNPYYLEQKKLELKTWKSNLFGITSKAIEWNLIPKAAEFCNVPSTQNIVDIASAIEEDIAIMYKGALHAICFCFPSSWIPRSKLGMTLEYIHKDVADGDTLVKSSPKIAQAMCETSFRRHVWTITTSPRLSNYPKYEKMPLKSIDDLYFRVETQTTSPLAENASLFFVKVDVVPLKDVLDKQIINSINSMSDDVLTYKNLHENKKFINDV